MLRFGQLPVPHGRIASVSGEHLVVRSLLNDEPVFENDDQVGIHYG